MSEITIRRAVKEDIPVIREITLDAFTQYAREIGLPDQVDALRETPEDIGRDIRQKNVLIAYYDSIPCGTVRYACLPDGTAYISRFGVRSSMWKSGVGRELIRAVKEDCAAMGVKEIKLYTASKVAHLARFYYGQGFYIHSTTTEKGYIRALFICELTDERA